MALTGLALVGFLVSHLAGNLLIFVGPNAFNSYSHALISNPLIYLAEILLLVFFLTHAVNGILFTAQNKAARPEAYYQKKLAGGRSRKSIASSTMIVSGILVLIFIPLHLWTFKYGAHYESPGEPPMRDLHRLVLEIFQNPFQVVWYVIAMIVIGFHLWHGFGSAFESLGMPYRKPLRCFGQLLAVAIAGGFLAIPVIIYLKGGAL